MILFVSWKIIDKSRFRKKMIGLNKSKDCAKGNYNNVILRYIRNY